MARGALSLRDERVDEFNRLCRVARLLSPTLQVLPEPPALYDATLLSAKPDLWALGGYELVETNGITCGHAQTWYLIPADVHEREEADARRHNELASQAESREISGRTRSWK